MWFLSYSNIVLKLLIIKILLKLNKKMMKNYISQNKNLEKKNNFRQKNYKIQKFNVNNLAYKNFVINIAI